MALNLGLLVFSFIFTSVLLVPFINLLYKIRFTRRVEAPKKGKIPEFDKIHDLKAGTPIGGGVLIVVVIFALYMFLFPMMRNLGVYIQGAYDVATETKIIFFSLLSFAALGLYDDIVKLYRKMEPGKIGMWVGLRRRQKFILQWVLAFALGFFINHELGVSIIHIPLIDKVVDLGLFYIPFSAFVIVSFANAVNITDGLDGLMPGILVICLFAFWIIAYQVFDTPISVFISIWLGSLIAFLYFNICLREF